MKIAVRVQAKYDPKNSAEFEPWEYGVENKQKYNCDACGAQLWVAPDGKTKYCDATHKVVKGSVVPLQPTATATIG